MRPPAAAPRADDPTFTLADARDALRSTLAPGAVAIERLGRGWDHDVFRVGPWVVRFPRNAPARDAIELERAVLPWIAPRVPIAVPVPVVAVVRDVGPSFAVHRALPGTTIADADLDAAARASLAPALAAFVRALHALDLHAAPVVLREDPIGRLDPHRRALWTQRRLELWRADGTLPDAAASALLAMLEDLPPRPEGDRDVLVHGDLHPRNLLVDADAPSGVIDWVDVHRGERAIDLALLFQTLPPRARGPFLEVYGAVPAASIARARWRAIDHMTRALWGSLERGDDAFVRAARRALLETAERD